MCKQCFSMIVKQFGNHLKINNNQLNISYDSLKLALDSIKCPAMKALEELTPGGSEYWENPKYCYDMIRDQRSSTHKLLVRTTQQRNDVHDELMEVRKYGCMPAAPSWNTNLSTEDKKIVIKHIGDMLMGHKPELNDK